MIKAHNHLIKYFIKNHNAIFSILDEEGVLQKQTTNTKLLREAIDSVEECLIRIYIDGKKAGIAVVCHQGSDPQTICDHSDNDLLEAWWTEYDRLAG